jgi:hypothetical protein
VGKLINSVEKRKKLNEMTTKCEKRGKKKQREGKKKYDGRNWQNYRKNRSGRQNIRGKIMEEK